jgi:hypothetical protein
MRQMIGSRRTMLAATFVVTAAVLTGVAVAAVPQAARITQAECAWRGNATVCAPGDELVIPVTVGATTSGGWCPIVYDWGDGSTPESWEPPASGGSHEYRHTYATAGSYTLRNLVGDKPGCPSGTVERTYTITITGPTAPPATTAPATTEPEPKDKRTGSCVAKNQRSVHATGTRKGKTIVTVTLTVTACAKPDIFPDDWDFLCTYSYTVTKKKGEHIKNGSLYGKSAPYGANKTRKGNCGTTAGYDLSNPSGVTYSFKAAFKRQRKHAFDECADLPLYYSVDFNEQSGTWTKAVQTNGGPVPFKESLKCSGF